MNIKFIREYDKTGLRYMESLNVVKGDSSINMSTTENPTSYVNSFKGNNSQPNKSGNENNKQPELDHPNHANKYEARKQHTPKFYQVRRQREIPSSKFFIPRHPKFFYGFVFSCGNLGHKVVICNTFIYNINIGMRFNKPQMDMVQNYFNNSFSPLLNELECHICNNFDTRQVNEKERCCLSLSKTDNKILPRFGGRKIKTKKNVDWTYMPKVKKINGILIVVSPST
jgi:hypothetical protein